jgi:hypothetical protein
LLTGLWATPKGAITSWLTVGARFDRRTNEAEAGPPRYHGFSSTTTGSRPGQESEGRPLVGAIAGMASAAAGVMTR